jgi:5'(3')-deoxyribonucleotidase
MKIEISINEVLRDYIGQITYTYDKYIADSNIKEGDVTNFNLLEFFNLKILISNMFLYTEASLEIFGHADQLSDGLINHFNIFLGEIKDEEEHQIELVSREVEKQSLNFLLSIKTGCKIENIRFVTDYAKKWDGIDVLITANPKALESKPEGKISIKVNASYNKNVSADYEIDSLLEFMKNEEFRNKILNTKITSYEEI